MFFDDWHRMKRGVSVQGLTGDSIRRKKKKADGADHENGYHGSYKMAAKSAHLQCKCCFRANFDGYGRNAQANRLD